jgi:hypothetical protein
MMMRVSHRMRPCRRGPGLLQAGFVQHACLLVACLLCPSVAVSASLRVGAQMAESVRMAGRVRVFG